MSHSEEIALLIYERNFRSEELKNWFIKSYPERGTVYPADVWIEVYRLTLESYPISEQLTEAQEHHLALEVRYQILQLEIMMTGISLNEMLELDKVLDERDNYVESTLHYLFENNKNKL